MAKNHTENKNMAGITNDLAEFIASTNYQDLPENVINQAKLCFLDFLSVTLRGSQTKSAQIIKNLISADVPANKNQIRPDNKSNQTRICNNGKNGKSTIIGWGKVNPMDAALVNGVSSHSLDLDDGHRLAQLHPGTCIIPAALALSEAHDKSGKDLITAMVVGYQVAIQLGMILNPQHRGKGFHSTGTCGTLGAAAAASKIMNLDTEGILNALGLAGTQAAGLLESDHTGSMGKHLHAGKAAQSGVLSALLASNGFTGAQTILEGNEGLLKAMGGLKTLEKNVNWKNDFNKYEILGVYFKKYPVCRHLHSSIDAAISLVNNYNFNPADIQDITVETYEIAASHDNYQPETVEGIRQSLPVCVAIALDEGNLTVENILNAENTSRSHLVSKTHHDNRISETASKVLIKIDKKENNLYPHKRPSKVTIRYNDNLYTKRVELAKGEPENPFSKNELLIKFRDLNPTIKSNCLQNLDDLEYENIIDTINILNNEFKKANEGL